jgi:cell division protein FtsB
MKKWEERLKPENWSWSWILGILTAFLLINFLAPKGLLHLVLLKQQNTQLQYKIAEIQNKIESTQNEIKAFENNAEFQKHILRDRMGYLRSNEFRIEFVSSPKKHIPSKEM